MKILLFNIIIMIAGINLYSQNYNVYESQSGLKIKFDKIIGEDTLFLPNYLFSKQNDELFLKLNIVVKDNDIEFVHIDGNSLNYDFIKEYNYRDLDVFNLIINSNLLKDSSTLVIKFKKKINLSEKTSIELNLFPNVINRKHLKYILNTKSFKSKDKTLLKSDDFWYEYNSKYLKLITNKDGVWKVDVNKVIEKFGNVNINNFFITKFGKNYNKFYIKSNDEILTADDEFYLFGEIAKGDSTNFEHYTDDVVYYLYHNQEKQNNFLELQNKNINLEQNYIERDYFYEKDSLYSFGYNFTITSTNNNYYEGWYMALLDATLRNSNTYIFRNRMFPYKKEASANARVVTFLEHQAGTFDFFNIHPYQNNKKLDTMVYRGFHRLDLQYNNDLLLPGLNSFTVKSELYIKNLQRFRDSLEIIEPGRMGVDFFKFKGKFYPIADKGQINFISKDNTDKKVKIYNFNSPNIISIDTIQNKITFNNGMKSDFIIGGTNFETDYSTLTYNDMSIMSLEKGILLIYGENGEQQHLTTASITTITNILNRNLDFFVILSNLDGLGNLSNALNAKGITPNTSNFIAARFGNDTYYNNLTIFDNEYFQPIEWQNAKKYVSDISFLSGENSIISNDSESIEFVRIEEINLANLRASQNKADILYISHKSLQNSLNKYLDYRKSTHPDLDFKIVFIEDIYDEFGYGQEKPHSIKEFLKYAFANWTEPKLSYVYFIGESSWDPKMIGTSSRVKNLVPTYGLPVSDVWFQNLTRNDRVIWNDILVSRITPNNDRELEAYLSKLIEFEKTTKAAWLKNFLVIAGGNESEQPIFTNQTQLAFMPLTNSSLCVDTTYILGLHDRVQRTNQGNDIRRKINNGVLWTNFIGHGAVNVFDFDGWAENQLNNFGRTGILSTISCNTNAFAEAATPRSRNEAYIMQPETGFIFTFGGTTLGSTSVHNVILSDMFKAMSDKNYNLRNLLELKHFATKNLQDESFFITNYLTFNNLGDPLINIPLAYTSDLYPLEDETEIISENNFITIDDSTVIFSTNIYNNGYKTDDNIIVKLIHSYSNIEKIYWDTLNAICIYSNYQKVLEIDNFNGLHKVVIIIDPNDLIEEDDKDNNRLEFTFNVFNSNLIPIEPKSNWNILHSNQKFRFYDPSANKDRSYKFRLEYEGNIIESNNDEIIISDGAFVTWQPYLILPNSNNINLYYIANETSEENYEQVLKLHTKDVIQNETNYLVNENNMKLNNLAFDNNSIKFKTNELEFILSSEFGAYKQLANPERDRNHTFDFFLNGEGIFNSSAASTGIYLVKVSKINGKYEPYRRFFNTWGFVDGRNFFDDGIEFVNFLKDSVSNDDYVFFSVVGSGLRIFTIMCNDAKTDFCIRDTLVSILEEKYSAEYAHTLNESFDKYLGYSFFGSPSFDKSQKMEIVASYDELENNYIHPEINGTIDLHNLNAELEINNIRDLKKLNSIRIEGENQENSIMLELYDNNQNTIIQFEQFELNIDYDLSFLDNTLINYKLYLSREDFNSETIIDNIFINYKSFPELGIINNVQNVDSIMRGEDFVLNHTIKNYSFRNDMNHTSLILRGNNQQIYSKPLDKISAEEEINFIDTLSTNNLLSNNNFVHILNNQFRTFEPVSNNNISNSGLYIYEDTIPPVLRVYANDVEVFDQSFISMDPLIRVEMYDNSKLPINDKRNFTRVRFNGWVNDDDISFNNDFTYKNDGELKAYIEFTREGLDIGDVNTNILEITARDATGNQTSVEFYLNISRVVRLGDVLAFPNPFNDNVSIKFNYTGFESPQTVEIHIYDLSGRYVNTIEKDDVKIGENIYIWDGKNQNGSNVITGNYLVLIKIKEFNNTKESILIQKN